MKSSAVSVRAFLLRPAWESVAIFPSGLPVLNNVLDLLLESSPKTTTTQRRRHRGIDA